MDAQFDLELLQTLLFGREVVNIRVGQIIRLTEETGMFVDDAVRQCIELFRRPPQHTSPKHMIVVLAVIEADEPVLCQCFDFAGGRIHHAMNRLILACQFPVDEEKVRKNLTVKERDRGLQNISLALCFLFGLEMHLCHRLDANISLIRAACGKEQDSIAHIVHVIDHVALVCLLHDMGNKIHIRLRVGADFLGKCLFDQYPQMPFVLDLLCIDHFFSLQRQTTADGSHRNIIAFRQLSPQ